MEFDGTEYNRHLLKENRVRTVRHRMKVVALIFIIAPLVLLAAWTYRAGYHEGYEAGLVAGGLMYGGGYSQDEAFDIYYREVPGKRFIEVKRRWIFGAGK